MTISVTGFNTKVSLRASNTFPAPIVLTQFPGDESAISIEDIEIGQHTGGLEERVAWNVYAPIVIDLNIIAGGENDDLLNVLLLANRAEKGKELAQDILTMSIIYPNGRIRTYGDGSIMSGPGGLTVDAERKLKTNLYKFGFDTIII